MVDLGANACIIGRNPTKTESMAKDIATARKGAKVIGIGQVDVRSLQSLEKAVETCVQELGAIDFVMWVCAFMGIVEAERMRTNMTIGLLELEQQATFSPQYNNSAPMP